mmetsp:Transcript_89331/g.251493  ORF Transcript_89331/g.251493 Transcript_89331/m.251493 type:complete len:84 (+) Transcript_89331:171-422(+)
MTQSMARSVIGSWTRSDKEGGAAYRWALDISRLIFGRSACQIWTTIEVAFKALQVMYLDLCLWSPATASTFTPITMRGAGQIR